MKKDKRVTGSDKRLGYRRVLAAEQLEKRELLAGDLACRAVFVPPSDAIAPLEVNSAIVATTNSGAQSAARGLPQRDFTAAVRGVGNAAPVVSADMSLQQRNRTGESTTGDGRLKRPRDRDSQDVSLVTPQVAPTAQRAALRGEGNGSQQNPVSQLSQVEMDDLLHLREEEKLARDVYLALGAEWNLPIFANIAASEQQHMDSVGTLIQKYGLQDPVVDDTPGEFTNPAFSTLYDQLVEAGSRSVLDAYQVGAMIEEMDIVDLREALAGTTHTDIQNVYENLMRGSRNHLRAFAAEIEKADATYVAQYLTQDEFDAIASTPIETGNGGKAGGSPNRGTASIPSSPAIAPTTALDLVFSQVGQRRGGRSV